jgi:hypothetical protein
MTIEFNKTDSFVRLDSLRPGDFFVGQTGNTLYRCMFGGGLITVYSFENNDIIRFMRDTLVIPVKNIAIKVDL